MPWHVVWISQRKRKKPLALKPSPCDGCHSSQAHRLAASFMEVISCRLFSFSTSAWAKCLFTMPFKRQPLSDHSEDKQDLLKIWGESKTTSNIEQLQWRNVSQVDLLQLLHPWCSPQISYCCPHPAWTRGGLFVSDLTGRLYTKKCCACKLHDPLSISSIQCTHCLRCFQSFFYL